MSFAGGFFHSCEEFFAYLIKHVRPRTMGAPNAEPRAVASGCKHSMLNPATVFNSWLTVTSARYRSRFCICELSFAQIRLRRPKTFQLYFFPVVSCFVRPVVECGSK